MLMEYLLNFKKEKNEKSLGINANKANKIKTADSAFIRVRVVFLCACFEECILFNIVIFNV